MTWILTSTGRRFDLERPKAADVTLEDIAHALAMQCRFNGHTKHHYSVAQHSVLVSLHVPDGLRLHALLHDGHEAYVGDIVNPLKMLLFLSRLEAIVDGIDSAIRERFGLRELTGGEIAVIKQADLEALRTEARDLLPGGGEGLPELRMAEPWPAPIRPMSIGEARDWFRFRFLELSPFAVDEVLGDRTTVNMEIDRGRRETEAQER